jgi:hypothetical protein
MAELTSLQKLQLYKSFMAEIKLRVDAYGRFFRLAKEETEEPRHIIKLPTGGDILLAAILSSPDGAPHCSIWTPLERRDGRASMRCVHRL